MPDSGSRGWNGARITGSGGIAGNAALAVEFPTGAPMGLRTYWNWYSRGPSSSAQSEAAREKMVAKAMPLVVEPTPPVTVAATAPKGAPRRPCGAGATATAISAEEVPTGSVALRVKT